MRPRLGTPLQHSRALLEWRPSRDAERVGIASSRSDRLACAEASVVPHLGYDSGQFIYVVRVERGSVLDRCILWPARIERGPSGSVDRSRNPRPGKGGPCGLHLCGDLLVDFVILPIGRKIAEQVANLGRMKSQILACPRPR